MAKKLPLSVKIILPLITLQIAAIAIGIIWLTSWLESSRFRELEHILDTQTDVMEDSVFMRDGNLQFNLSGELPRELNEDRNYYFAILSENGSLIQETQGPSESIRADIRTQLKSLEVRDEKIATAKFSRGQWQILRETIDKNMLFRKAKRSFPGEEGERPIAYLYAGINADPVIAELSLVAKTISIGAVFFFFIVTFGTAAIVSGMTANLHKFVKSLENVKPENPTWNPPTTPKSLEEQQLFTSFHDMMISIQEAAENQRLFIANASHELKTPVAGMLMSLEVMLTKERSAAEYEATCRKLLATVKGLKRLSSALLDLSRISYTTRFTKQTVELEAVFNSLIARWDQVAEAKNIELTWAFDDHPAQIVTNQDLLEVALGNFIDNAIKYSKPRGQVKVSCHRDEAHKAININIEDNGIGMNTSDLKNLGQVFFRGSESRSENHSYGLGFSQADKIIRMIGGSLKVTSSLNVGTTVSVTIPS